MWLFVIKAVLIFGLAAIGLHAVIWLEQKRRERKKRKASQENTSNLPKLQEYKYCYRNIEEE